MFVQNTAYLNTDFIISTRRGWKQGMFFLCPRKCHCFQKFYCVEFPLPFYWVEIPLLSTGSRWENQTSKLIAPKISAFQKQDTKLKREPRQKKDISLAFGSNDLPIIIIVAYGKFSVAFPPHQAICTSSGNYLFCLLHNM